MKQFKHGMVLGKFYPPHKGHLYLIDTAIKQAENITVFICSLETETIPGSLRFEWLARIYKDNPNVTVYHVNKELPQTPEEHGDFDDFYRIWCDVVYSRLASNLSASEIQPPTLDVLFTSEIYGEEFAEKLNIEHVMVDLERSTYPTSGTSIRTNFYDNWEYVPDIVKPHMKKKILVIGTESTGKSTLVEKLANFYNGDVVEEYGREYTDTIQANSMRQTDFEVIAIAHDNMITDVIRNGKFPLVFIDTDAITTKMFGEMYLGDNFKSKVIDTIIDNQEFDLILLCDIDVPWVNDGTRDFPNDRERHMKKIQKELELLNCQYVIIAGDYNERFESAKKAVNNLIQSVK